MDYLFSRSPIFSAALYSEIINLEPSVLSYSFCSCVLLCVLIIKPSKLYTIYLDLLFLGTQGKTKCGKCSELKITTFLSIIYLQIEGTRINTNRLLKKQVRDIDTLHVFIPCFCACMQVHFKCVFSQIYIYI